MFERLDRDFLVLDCDMAAEDAKLLLSATSAKTAIVMFGEDRAYRALSVKELQRRYLQSETWATDLRGDQAARCAVVDVSLLSPADVSVSTLVVDALGPLGILHPGTRAAGLFGFFDGAHMPRSLPALQTRLSGDVARSAEPRMQRSLEAGLPDSAVVGDPVELVVSLVAGREASGQELELQLPLAAEILVFVETRDALRLTGAPHCCLKVSEPQEAAVATFQLEARAPGVGVARVFAFWGSTPLGSLELRMVVNPKERDDDVRDEGSRTTIVLSTQLQTDLSLIVRQQDNELSFFLQTADGSHTFTSFGDTELSSSPEQYFRNFFDGIDRLRGDSPDAREHARLDLEARGADLAAKILPRALRRELWQRRDEIKSVIILSQDPWIPWELCYIDGDGADESGGFFLAQQFMLGRWYPGTPAAPRISLSDIALVAPRSADLKHAEVEREFLLSLRGQARQIEEIAPNLTRVTSAMELGRYDAWHFVGHGRVSATTDADGAIFELNNDEKLTPAHVSGKRARMLTTRPFVFLNACQSGRGGISLTRPGGWANRFIGDREKGGSAFVGSYWRVFDDAASAFSRQLYQLLLSGMPIGNAVRTARLAIRDMDQISWLAYTVHAHPLARVDLRRPRQ